MPGVKRDLAVVRRQVVAAQAVDDEHEHVGRTRPRRRLAEVGELHRNRRDGHRPCDVGVRLEQVEERGDRFGGGDGLWRIGRGAVQPVAQGAERRIGDHPRVGGAGRCFQRDRSAGQPAGRPEVERDDEGAGGKRRRRVQPHVRGHPLQCGRQDQQPDGDGGQLGHGEVPVHRAGDGPGQQHQGDDQHRPRGPRPQPPRLRPPGQQAAGRQHHAVVFAGPPMTQAARGELRRDDRPEGEHGGTGRPAGDRQGGHDHERGRGADQPAKQHHRADGLEASGVRGQVGRGANRGQRREHGAEEHEVGADALREGDALNGTRAGQAQQRLDQQHRQGARRRHQRITPGHVGGARRRRPRRDSQIDGGQPGHRHQREQAGGQRRRPRPQRPHGLADDGRDPGHRRGPHQQARGHRRPPIADVGPQRQRGEERAAQHQPSVPRGEAHQGRHQARLEELFVDERHRGQERVGRRGQPEQDDGGAGRGAGVAHCGTFTLAVRLSQGCTSSRRVTSSREAMRKRPRASW